MNKQFITYLGNKLKVGNLRTIHLNALPGRFATRLDITDLEILDGNSQQDLFQNKIYKNANDFIFNHLLVKPSFNYKISFEKINNKASTEQKKLIATMAKRLNALVHQNEDDFLEHGVKSFGFGYPLLVKRSRKDPSKIIKAPLLIWNLNISRSTNFQDQWIIERNEDAPIYINEVLLSHIANDEGIKLDDVPWTFSEDGLIERIKLTELVSWFLHRFGTKTFDVFPKIEPCSDAKAIEQKAGENPLVLWSGIFGLYRTQKQSIIKDIEFLTEKFSEFDFSHDTKNSVRVSSNAGVRTDPSQHEIIHSLFKKEYKIIQGPPGTGKSQSLTAIVTNMLENRQKILVVCEKKTALDVLHANLRALGLDKLVAMVDDIETDRKKIIDTVREIAEREKPGAENFNEKEYDTNLQKFNELVSEFNEKHKHLLAEIFEGKNLQELIAGFIAFKRVFDPKENVLDKLTLSLSAEEYHKLLTAIEKCADAFAGIEPESLVFDHVKATFFTQGGKATGFFEKVTLVKPQIELLNPATFDAFSNFDFSLLFDAGTKRFSPLAFKAGLEKLISCLDAVKLLEKELLLLKEITTLEYILNENEFLNRASQLVKLIERVEMYRQALENLREEALQVEKEFEAIAVFTGNKDLKRPFGLGILNVFSGKHKKLHTFWNAYRSSYEKYRAVNKENTFVLLGKKIQDAITEAGLNDVHRQSMIGIVGNFLKYKDLFADYTKWRTFFEAQPNEIRGVIAQMRLNGWENSNEWPAHFKYAYIDKLLAKTTASGAYNTNERTLVKIAALQTVLRKQQSQKINRLWGEIQAKSIDEFNKRANINWLFNYRANSQYSKKNSLRKIVTEEFDLFTDIFPVLFVNPVVCSSILPLKTGIFDIVLFDEASQLRLEETYTALLRGKVKVISGDRHQMPPSSFFQADIVLETTSEEEEEKDEQGATKSLYEKENPLFLADSESLLDFGNNMNPAIVGVSFLDYHYRSRHPYLIDFSNSAFYGSRLVPMPEKTTYRPIRYFQVGGLYEEGNINTTEAKRIVEFLKNDYPVNPDGSFPSLGIATFNLQQRNLLKDFINSAAIEDPAFREKLEKIGEKEEWFVKNLENVQGDERDIIIISTTFGVNASGTFRQNFGPVNTQKGYRLLNVIITRAKMQLLVFTSVPESAFVSKYQDDLFTNGNKGKAVFYAYLDYCKSIEEGNEEKRLSILELLNRKCEEVRTNLTNQFAESNFEAEVFEYLKPHFGNKLVPQYKLGGYTIDFAVLNEAGKPIVAIECDGAKWHKTDEAYLHDLHRKNIVESYGIKSYAIWSANWWPDPQNEIRKLVKFVGEG